MAYLGETIVPVEQSPFAHYTKERWALFFIEDLGDYDGEHHKAYALDQVARVLLGSPIVIKRAQWSDYKAEWRITVGEPSEAYKAWELSRRRPNGGDEDEYEYDKGIAP